MRQRPQAAPLTREDYYNLPDNGLRYQLIEGELYMAPVPNLYHQTISGNLSGVITGDEVESSRRASAIAEFSQ